jgi:hypothetical protein
LKEEKTKEEWKKAEKKDLSSYIYMPIVLYSILFYQISLKSISHHKDFALPLCQSYILMMQLKTVRSQRWIKVTCQS